MGYAKYAEDNLMIWEDRQYMKHWAWDAFSDRLTKTPTREKQMQHSITANPQHFPIGRKEENEC